MRPHVRSWFRQRTYHWSQWSPEWLRDHKHGNTISVVLPALNEEPTVGQVVTTVRDHLMTRTALIDELLVIDSGSTDRTVAVAQEAGAVVVRAADIRPELAARPGKGEVLWKSQFITTGDILVFVDSDLVDAKAHYVTGLLGPLLTHPSVCLVKAFYDRPLTDGRFANPTGGGRVTELVARPLLNLYWPDLAGVVQPLAGEYAARRETLAQLPFAAGYGVEIGLLIDTLNLHGLDGLAQVDLGRRDHRHQDDSELALMAATIIDTALQRTDRPPHRAGAPALTQFQRADGAQRPTVRPVPVGHRPPCSELSMT
jgi:glucosyl-3-phosphoglycerate synthase